MTATHDSLRTPETGMNMNPVSRSSLRTRPRHQRILIRYWEYIPAVRITVLTIRLLVLLAVTIAGIALLTNSNWWGLLALGLVFAALPFSLWIFSTASKGWPTR
jgi:hypothetical protein